jgi:hypothetical protein
MSSESIITTRRDFIKAAAAVVAALMQGTPPFHASTVLPKVDVIVAGEQREWEGVEYAFDANTAGERKGMILVGH